MCFFKKKPPVPVTVSEKTVVHFGKNQYPDGQSLSGCVPDSNNAIAKIGKLWPDVKFIQKLDGQCTAKTYLEVLEQEISLLPAGGTPLLVTDSCFSESVTRFMGQVQKYPPKPRLFNPGYPRRDVVRSSPLHPKEGMKWLHISACGEHQTAADAYFKGGYEGALHHFLLKCLVPGITYRQLFAALRDYLPSNQYSQIPSLEGPDYLQNRVLFDGPTLWIMNSSHGSYEYDESGDEADGMDEGIYFDRLIRDDEIYERLMKIKV